MRIILDKNIIFIPCVPSKHLSDVDNYKELSLSTWRHYANRIGAELMIMDTPLRNPDEMKITWQRWYVHDILESNNVEYDNIFMVDVDTMIHWNAPNIFEECANGKFRACVDNDNLGWLKESIEGYQHMFPDTRVDWETYFNCGIILMNKEHKDLCKTITTFYETNEEHLLELQHKTLKKGSDQTPVNYMVNRDVEFELMSKRWNLTHMMRKEILNYFMFVDTAWLWHFNGFEKTMRTQVMQAYWENFGKNYEIK